MEESSRTSGATSCEGDVGPQGAPGMKGDKGDTRAVGPCGPSCSGGLTYIRWGQTTCPDTPGTELIYSGRAAGSYFDQKGGTSDYLCSPDTPQYLTSRPGVQGNSPIYGTEYQIHSTLPIDVDDHTVPCAVCTTQQRTSLLMIPARISCTDSWTLEYNGYLMTENKRYYRKASEFIDKDPETVPGEASNSNGVLFYHAEAVCNGLQCPPYDQEKELTCAICTK